VREVFRVCDGVPTIVLQGMETGGMAWLLRKTIMPPFIITTAISRKETHED
jgi:hypothetical protein